MTNAVPSPVCDLAIPCCLVIGTLMAPSSLLGRQHVALPPVLLAQSHQQPSPMEVAGSAEAQPMQGSGRLRIRLLQFGVFL